MTTIVYLIIALVMTFVTHATWKNKVDREDKLIMFLLALITLSMYTIAVISFFRVIIFTI